MTHCLRLLKLFVHVRSWRTRVRAGAVQTVAGLPSLYVSASECWPRHRQWECAMLVAQWWRRFSETGPSGRKTLDGTVHCWWLDRSCAVTIRVLSAQLHFAISAWLLQVCLEFIFVYFSRYAVFVSIISLLFCWITSLLLFFVQMRVHGPLSCLFLAVIFFTDWCSFLCKILHLSVSMRTLKGRSNVGVIANGGSHQDHDWYIVHTFVQYFVCFFLEMSSNKIYCCRKTSKLIL